MPLGGWHGVSSWSGRPAGTRLRAPRRGPPHSRREGCVGLAADGRQAGAPGADLELHTFPEEGASFPSVCAPAPFWGSEDTSLLHLGRNAPPGQEGLPAPAGVSGPRGAAWLGSRRGWGPGTVSCVCRPCRPQPCPCGPPARNSCHQRRGARRGGKGCGGRGLCRVRCWEGGGEGEPPGLGWPRAISPFHATSELRSSPPKSLACILTQGLRGDSQALSPGFTEEGFILSAPPRPDRGGLQGQCRPYNTAPRQASPPPS